MDRDQEKFVEWCDNINGELEWNDTQVCHFPNDGGYATFDGETLSVVDEESQDTKVDVMAIVPSRESGPFRHDRVNPPRESTTIDHDVGDFYPASPLDIDGNRLTAGDPGYEGVHVSVHDVSTASVLQSNFDGMSRDEIEKRLSEINEKEPGVGHQMREDLERIGIL